MENINPKLNLDELPQIDKPEGKQNTHTKCGALSLWGPKTPFHQNPFVQTIIPRVNHNLHPLVKWGPHAQKKVHISFQIISIWRLPLISLLLWDHWVLTKTEHTCTQTNHRPPELRVRFSNVTRTRQVQTTGHGSGLVPQLCASMHVMCCKYIRNAHWEAGREHSQCCWPEEGGTETIYGGLILYLHSCLVLVGHCAILLLLVCSCCQICYFFICEKTFPKQENNFIFKEEKTNK